MSVFFYLFFFFLQQHSEEPHQLVKSTTITGYFLSLLFASRSSNIRMYSGDSLIFTEFTLY